MHFMNRLLLAAVWTAAALFAQTQPSIQANGSATINVDPDQASLNVGVITQAGTAQAAAEQNAAAAATMINALKSVLGSNGTIKTIYYSISPRYNNAQPAAIVGYTVSNTVQVVSNNINLVGPLIDAANTAGANSISGPNFGLQDPEPVLQKALAAAAKEAAAHAAAIASGLGGKVGAVISAQESGGVIPLTGNSLGAGAAATATPIQNGTVGVTANVSVTMAFSQ
jgi:uncharacterized protein YggE